MEAKNLNFDYKLNRHSPGIPMDTKNRAVLMILNSYYPEIRGRTEKMREIAEVLQNAGYSVFIMFPSNKRRGTYKIGNVTVFSIYYNLPRILLSIDWRVFNSLIGYNMVAFHRAKKIVAERKIDIVYSVNWPIYSHLMAYLLKKFSYKRDLKWVADLRDPLTDHPQLREKRLRSLFTKVIEKVVAGNGDRILINSGYGLNKTIFDSRYPGSIHRSVQMPYFGVNFKKYENIPKSLPAGKFTIAYTGRVTLDKDIFEGLYLFFCCYRRFITYNRLNPDKTSFVYAGDMHKEIRSMIEEAGIKDYFSYKGMLNFDELAGLLKSSWALLLVQDTSEKSKDYVYAKTWDYIAAKRPIIAIANQGGKLQSLIADYGLGCCINKQEDLESSLNSLYRDFLRKRNDFSLPSSIYSEMSREVYLNKMVDVFNDTINR